MATIILGGIGLLGILGLALVRQDLAVAAGFLLLGVVVVEPAPPDGIFLVVMIVAALTGRLHISHAPLAAIGLVGLFVTINLLSAAEALDTGRALRYLAITLYLGAFAVWVAGYVDRRRRARALVIAYLAGAVVVALAASVALFVPFPGHDLLLYYDGRRAQGLFKDANVYGPFLVPGALVLMHELLEPRLLRLRRPLIFAMVAILAIAVLLSYSRAAWLNLVVGTVVMLAVTLLRRRGARRALTLAVAGVSLAFVLLTAITVTGSGAFLAERAQLHAYDSERFSAQESGLGLAERHLLGVGPGQFEIVEPIASHSLYVRVLAEQGYLGFAVLLALILLTLVLGCANVVTGRDTWGIGAAALLGAWCGVLANSAFVDTLHWRHLWLIAGLVWAGSVRRTRVTAAPQSAP